MCLSFYSSPSRPFPPPLKSPPKGATIPYRPSPTPGTVLLAGNQVFEASDFGSHPLFSLAQGGLDLQQELKAAPTSAEDPVLLLSEPWPGRHINTINSCLK
ncbi:hypothetical protein AMECASPLE_023602 [Ameca splendens]|uniref:Uncharacterized protein n=1 Tax=Ameca splendens TaxID=208324 RepID=A0ABV0XT23_9TELE